MFSMRMIVRRARRWATGEFEYFCQEEMEAGAGGWAPQVRLPMRPRWVMEKSSGDFRP